MEIKNIVNQILNEKKEIKNVVWIACGGSNGNNFGAHYFMSREAKNIHSEMFTSNEFVYAPPKYVGSNTIAILTSMKGTPETSEAAKVANELGAATIGLYGQESLLSETCHYGIQYESLAKDDSDQGKSNSAYCLQLAIEILNATEGYAHYNEAMSVFPKLNDLYIQGKEKVTPLAAKWAQENKDKNFIQIMGCGPASAAAYTFSICNVMEMLQIQSNYINCCEFFHGPFEIVDQDTSIFLLVSEGRTRKADERVITFLNKYGGDKVYTLEAKELGIDSIDASVREYFNHSLFTPILNNVYMREMAKAIDKDYTSRRYMWKVEY